MRKTEINNTLGINTQERTPERFGFTEKQAAKYREQLFRGDSEGVFLYEWKDSEERTGNESGGWYYNKVANSAGYNVSTVESSILEKMNTVWHRLAKRKNHIELGTAAGIANKFKNVIFPLFGKKRKDGYTHIDIDTSSSLIDSCRKEYTDQEHLSFNPIVQDRRQKGLVDEINDKAYYRLGGSIGNFSEDQVVEILRNLSSDSSVVGRNIIITHFLRPEEPDKQKKIEQLKQQYSGPEVQEWIMKGFTAVGLDTDNLSFAVEYEPGVTTPDCIKVGAKLIKDTWIDIGGGDKVLKHAGEHIWAIRSRRYTKEQFGTLAEKAGCSLQDSVMADDASMAVSVLKTARKKISLPTKITSAVAGSLLLLFSGIQTGKMVERADRHKKQEKLKQEIVMGTQGTMNTEYFTDREQESEKMIYILEHRYGNILTEETRATLSAMMNDFLLSEKGQQFLNKYKRMGGGPDHYDHLYVPTLLHQFVADNPTQLKSLHVNTIAHSDLLQYHDALENTYFYQGDVVSFENNDVEEIGIYRAEHVGWVTGDDHPETGEPGGISVKCGIVKRKGNEYFVHKLGSDPYRLSEKNSALRSQGILSSGDMAAEILSKGQIQIITEKIYKLLVNTYGDNYPMYINGREDIARWLLDWYANGGDLEFLMYATQKADMFNESILKNFVLRVCIPELLPQLEKSMTTNAIDRSSVGQDIETVGSILPTVALIQTFLERYLGSLDSWETIQSGRVKSTLVRLLLTDKTREKLDICDPQIMRAWITKHSAMLRENGIMVPAFPEWVERFLNHTSSPYYYPDDNFEGLKEKDDVESIYSGALFPDGYTDISGNHYICGIYQKKIFGDGRLVARIINKKIEQKIRNQYQIGLFEQPQIRTPRGNFPIIKKEHIIQALLKEEQFYSSQNAHNLIDDYTARKQAMEKLKK